jgi:hypothetical protein
MNPCESKGMLCMTCRAYKEGIMPTTQSEGQKYSLWACEDSTDHSRQTLLEGTFLLRVGENKTGLEDSLNIQRRGVDGGTDGGQCVMCHPLRSLKDNVLWLHSCLASP